jgi:hypothetical protein
MVNRMFNELPEPLDLNKLLFRILPLTDDYLQIENIANKNFVQIIIGGPPPTKSPPQIECFNRDWEKPSFLRRPDWMVCYLVGSVVNIAQMKDDWLDWVTLNS